MDASLFIGDNNLSPILGFSDEGTFDPDDIQNYLTEMLNNGYKLVGSITTPETNNKYSTVLVIMEKETGLQIEN